MRELIINGLRYDVAEKSHIIRKGGRVRAKILLKDGVYKIDAPEHLVTFLIRTDD